MMKLPKPLIKAMGAKKAAEFERLVENYESAKKHHDEMISKGYVAYYLTPIEVELIEARRKNCSPC